MKQTKLFLFALLALVAGRVGAVDVENGTPMITNVSQLSSPYSDSQEGQHLEYLVDGDAGTYWHSDWHGEALGDYHWIQIDLTKPETGTFVLYMMRRNSSQNDNATCVNIIASNDESFNESFEVVPALDLPFNGIGTETLSETWLLTSPARYLRIAVTETNSDFRKFWHAAELQIFRVGADFDAWSTSVVEYLNTITSYTGLHASLQESLNQYLTLPEGTTLDDSLAVKASVDKLMVSIQNAVSEYETIQTKITQAEDILSTDSVASLISAVELAQKLDAATMTVEEIHAAYNLLVYELKTYDEEVLYQSIASIPQSDWSFSSTEVTIDGLVYQLDVNNKLAQFYYAKDCNTITSLSIPGSVKYNGVDYVVVSTYGSWRYKYSQLTSLTLPATLIKLGDYALAYMENVNSVTIPRHVTTLGSYVFSSSDYLRRITMLNPEPPTCAGSLSGSDLKVLTVPDSSYTAYRMATYWKDCRILPVHLNEAVVELSEPGELGSLLLDQVPYLQEVNKLTISGTLDQDDWGIMKSLINLVSLDMSNVTNTAIPSGQFSGCYPLEHVVLPSALRTINEKAFYQCYYIRNIDFPATLTSIGSYAFAYTWLRKAILPPLLKSISTYTFRGCGDLTEVSIPEGVTAIGSFAFYDCGSLTEVSIPEGVTAIEWAAFAGCSSLETIALPSSTRLLEHGAFSGCTRLHSVALNEGLTSIVEYAFGDCTSLTEITLPSTLTTLSNDAFRGSEVMTIHSHAVIPPTVYSEPFSTAAVLYVPAWSLVEYQTADYWRNILDIRASDYMPQNILVNKDFQFAMRDEIDPEYRPNIYLDWTSTSYTDGQGYSDYMRGNLKVNSRSKLPVNNFEMYYSPFAKYEFDYSINHNSYERTEYNPTCLIVNGEMRAEEVKIHLMNYNKRWQFVSFPFDVRVGDIVPDDSLTQWVIRSYSGEKRALGMMDSTWVNLKADSVLVAGRGYIMQCSNPNTSTSDPVYFTVTPIKESVNRQLIFESGNRTLALEEHQAEFDQNRSWNLIGNPYPSFYDTRYMEFTSPITVWNSRENSYAAFSPVDDKYILSPGEAFFVQRPVDEENITFTAAGRQTHRHPLAIQVPANAPAYAQAASRMVYNLTLVGEDMTDRTRVVLNERASMDYELQCDASKFMSENAEQAQLYTVCGDVRYAINERPVADCQTTLGMQIGKSGSYTLSLAEDAPSSVVVLDRLLGTSTTLEPGEGYTFVAEPGTIENRFTVRFNADATGIDQMAEGVEKADTPAYNLAGQRVDADKYQGVVVKKNRKQLQK